ncbi:FMN-binding protein [Streptomyces sp. NBC_01481]|uniref:FMN-binding protein n=1 Tax=Streptomyces sp. NBC_01481 TaxID=2975869 RepID=UPI0022511079|nr:FMN-binding protein [Streptomyces sp. NBC_01481]MCX4583380.1 FMN-binding protein [Streptomyces sp. NBC_01481]
MSTTRKGALRRVVLSSVVTVSGVVLMLALKPHTVPGTSVQAADPTRSVAPAPSGTPTTTASASARPSPSASKPAAASASKGPQTKAPTATRSASKPPSAPAKQTVTTRSVTGSTVQTKYGPVQVRITLSGDRITAASAVQSPSETPRSRDISSTAIPTLNQRTLSAQSADIDAVSGASYTSEGYIGSLQSALDKAGA